MITMSNEFFNADASFIENLCERHRGRLFFISHHDQEETVHILFKNEMNEDCFLADLESNFVGEVK